MDTVFVIHRVESSLMRKEHFVHSLHGSLLGALFFCNQLNVKYQDEKVRFFVGRAEKKDLDRLARMQRDVEPNTSSVWYEAVMPDDVGRAEWSEMHEAIIASPTFDRTRRV
jgi:hypothetical protein